MEVEKIEILPKGVRVQMFLRHDEVKNRVGLDYSYFLTDVLQRILENQAIDRLVEEKRAERELSSK